MGYSAGDPTCATWVCRLFQPEGKEVPKDSERNFELLPNCLREQNTEPVQEGDTTKENYTTLYVTIVNYELGVLNTEELSKASLIAVLSVSYSL